MTDRTCRGRIDSLYCGSGVDGTGLRCVVFFSGCNLRCPFCHNPETLFKAGQETDVGSLVSRILRYRAYFRRGGVTLSGGEPFLQKEFALALLQVLREEGIRTAAETNGHIADVELIGACDEIIVDIKNQETGDLSPYHEFFEVCTRLKKPLRVTNVLVPAVNDGEQKIAALARLLSAFRCTSVRFLPFRKLCEHKYEELKIAFPYAGIREAEEEDIAKANAVFSDYYNKNSGL